MSGKRRPQLRGAALTEPRQGCAMVFPPPPSETWMLVETPWGWVSWAWRRAAPLCAHHVNVLGFSGAVLQPWRPVDHPGICLLQRTRFLSFHPFCNFVSVKSISPEGSFLDSIPLALRGIASLELLFMLHLNLKIVPRTCRRGHLSTTSLYSYTKWENSMESQ